jgi:hypothetical protein
VDGLTIGAPADKALWRVTILQININASLLIAQEVSLRLARTSLLK